MIRLTSDLFRSNLGGVDSQLGYVGSCMRLLIWFPSPGSWHSFKEHAIHSFHNYCHLLPSFHNFTSSLHSMKYIKYSSLTWFSVYMWYLFNTTSVLGSVSATRFLVPSTSIRHFMTATNLFIHIKSQYLTTKCFKLHLELQSILQIVSGKVLQMQCTRLILKWYLTCYFPIHVLLFHKFIQNHWKTSQANRALN